MCAVEARIERIEATAYDVPTDRPEADGTLEWDSTTIVVVRISAGGYTGIGYSYTDASVATLIQRRLAGVVVGRDATAIPALWHDLVRSIRNLGRPGLCSMAIAAVDVALWDLKARLLHVPLVTLLGGGRPGIAVYGSGGFTSYPPDILADQLGSWVRAGIRMVKMKVGSAPEADVARVRTARAAIGDGAALFVDANGAYGRKQALAMAETFAGLGVSWFEEPVSSDDLEGLRLLRDDGPAGMDIAAGEYGFDQVYFRRMLQTGAVDVLQADATRCGGITGFMAVAALAQGFQIPLSAHTAPALHLHPGCAAPGVRHLEYFHDHVRIEAMLFDGAPTPRDGVIYPDLDRPGLGLSLREPDAMRYAA